MELETMAEKTNNSEAKVQTKDAKIVTQEIEQPAISWKAEQDEDEKAALARKTKNNRVLGALLAVSLLVIAGLTGLVLRDGNDTSVATTAPVSSQITEPEAETKAVMTVRSADGSILTVQEDGSDQFIATDLPAGVNESAYSFVARDISGEGSYFLSNTQLLRFTNGQEEVVYELSASDSFMRLGGVFDQDQTRYYAAIIAEEEPGFPLVFRVAEITLATKEVKILYEYERSYENTVDVDSSVPGILYPVEIRTDGSIVADEQACWNCDGGTTGRSFSLIANRQPTILLDAPRSYEEIEDNFLPTDYLADESTNSAYQHVTTNRSIGFLAPTIPSSTPVENKIYKIDLTTNERTVIYESDAEIVAMHGVSSGGSTLAISEYSHTEPYSREREEEITNRPNYEDDWARSKRVFTYVNTDGSGSKEIPLNVPVLDKHATDIQEIVHDDIANIMYIAVIDRQFSLIDQDKYLSQTGADIVFLALPFDNAPNPIETIYNKPASDDFSGNFWSLTSDISITQE